MVLLGTITNPGGGVSTNNTNTAVPFTIPFNIPRLLVVTPAGDGTSQFNILVGTGSSLAAAATSFGVDPSTSNQVDCPVGFGVATVLAIFTANAAATNITVYGIYGQAQN